MSPDNFSTIFYALTVGQETLETKLKLNEFLEQSCTQVITLVKANGFQENDDLVNIAAAYDSIHKDIEVNSSLFEALESQVFERAPTLSVTQAI